MVGEGVVEEPGPVEVDLGGLEPGEHADWVEEPAGDGPAGLELWEAADHVVGPVEVDLVVLGLG